ncbi:hypothetical protein [[Mycobacterium] nativiensis]|uniref:DUF1214 domain-containing protein n=1 Tax=[Mycobacterium] nativiensis TaxID=2855503 RepID=A0ABU5Y213_9MYCO|nr:hypothetical protein [Mycolicibacter sp. MYC340]MEB3034277.1 hypothetical protein [Mycolicibacter sp. MYC340]
MSTTMSADQPIGSAGPSRKPLSPTALNPGTRRIASDRVIRAAQLATMALTGALVLGVTAQPATPTATLPVSLTSADSSLQPVIDQILASMQHAQQGFEALPFATADSNAMLLASLQATNYELLMSSGFSQVTHGQVFFQVPEVTAGNASDYRPYFQFFTPDIYYRTAQGFDPSATYELTGKVGDGTGGIALMPINVGGSSAEGGGALELDSNLHVNPDGTFTVYIGPEAPPGAVNFIDSSQINAVLIRDMLNSWALGGSNFHITCTADCAPIDPGITATGLSDAMVSRLLHSIAPAVGPFNQLNMQLAGAAGILQPPNTMSDLASQGGYGVALPSAAAASGHFDLQPGEALIVKVPQIESAGMNGIELMNVFGTNLPATLAQTSLNGSQSFLSNDGYTYYVVSATNPGVANWLDSGAVTSGEIYMRYQNIPEADRPTTPLPVETQVVQVADVAKYLPTDTPTVSAAQYAADMNERVLSYGYALDTARVAGQPGWVTQQLWLHDLEKTMGTDNYTAVFGQQPETPMWLRFTPALSPDMLALAKAFLTDPSAGMTAIQDNWDLAMKDVALPIQLAQALLEKNFSQTADAVQSALSSGDMGQAVTALFAGGQQFGTILSDSLFDPNTSIISGILNARDDLATSVFTATGGMPDVANPLAALEWEFLPALAGSGWDFSSLLDPSGWADLDLGAVLDPSAYLAMLFS